MQNSRNKRVLVIGADSTLAQDFLERNTCEATHITTTSRRTQSHAVSTETHHNNTNRHVYFDLTQPEIPNALRAKEFDVAIVFAGMTNIAACEQHQALASEINHYSVVRLMQSLQVRHWILLSTNLVFSGTTPNIQCTAPYAPFNHYGLTKANMEQAALSLNKSLVIVRLTKVLMPRFTFLQNVITKLAAGQSCEVFNDMTMAPIWINEVSDVLYGLVHARRNSQGIIQLSANEDITYYHAANYCAERLQLPTGLLAGVPKSVSSPGFNSLANDNPDFELDYTAAPALMTLNKFIATINQVDK